MNKVTCLFLFLFNSILLVSQSLAEFLRIVYLSSFVVNRSVNGLSDSDAARSI